jgi:hypothetical protein
MVGERRCQTRNARGEPCGSPPLKQAAYCLMHSPDQQAASAARRLGGLRRRRETAVSGAFVFNGQGTVADIRRLVEIAAVDALELENSNQRSRTLAVLAHAALKLLEVGELQTRVEALERASTVPARRAG